MDNSTKTGLCFLLGLVLVPGEPDNDQRRPCPLLTIYAGVCSIFRTIETLSLNDPDITWAVSGVARWVCLEIETGFMIASLPMLWSPTIAAGKSAANHIWLWQHGYRSWRASRSGQLRLDASETTRSEKSEEISAPATRHHYMPEQQWHATGLSKSGSPRHVDSQDSMDHLRAGADGIMCRKDLEVFARKRSGQLERDDAAVERSQNVQMPWA